MSGEGPNQTETYIQDPPTTEQNAEQAAAIVALLDEIAGPGAAPGQFGQPPSPTLPLPSEHSESPAHDGRSEGLASGSRDAGGEGTGSSTDRTAGVSGQETGVSGESRSGIDNAEQEMAGQPANARQSLIQRHEAMLDQLAEVRQRSERHQRETRVVLQNGMRRIEEAMRSTDLAPTRTDSRQTLTIDSDSDNDEGLDQYLASQQRNQTIGNMLRREESRHQYRVLANARDIANESLTSTASMSLTSLPVSDTNSTSDHSLTARRDLERALRDYRIARRVLRTHYANDTNSSADQNNPTYQGVLAQLAEQQSNNRNRMRARGQSRTNTLERTDAIINRIAAAASIGHDTWRSDEDNDTMVGSSTSSAAQQDLTSFRLPRLIERNVAPVASNITSEPYLGPTSSAGDSGSATGGMRDFYRRVEDQERVRERNARRMGPPMLRPRPPEPDSAAVLPTISTQQDGGSSRQQRVQDTLDRLNGALSPTQNRPGSSASDVVKSRAKNVLKYLSGLKAANNDGDRALALAKDLGIDSLAESLARESEFDLPLRISELPGAKFSSWLSVGVSWKGIQKGGMGRPELGTVSMFGGFATGPAFEPGSIENRVFHLRAWRHRERLRAERRSLMPRDADASNPLPPAAAAEEERRLLSRLGTAGSDTLADVERHLSDLLEEEERRLNRSRDNGWRVNSVSFRPRSTANAGAASAERSEPKDQWPVQVTLHEVDWQKMTVSGTMVASQIAGRTRGAAGAQGQTSTDTNQDDNKDKEEPSPDMQTFFDGEIIDFHTHELETVADKPGYKVGGPLTDLKHWSQIGPFKAEVAKRVQGAQDKNAKDVYERLGISGTLDEQRAEYRRTFADDHDSIERLDKEELNDIAYDVMVECLGSRKWLEKACGEGGWIFMRWKERCFIIPPSSRPSSSSDTAGNNEHSRVRTIIHRPTSTHAYTTTYSDDRHHDRSGAWGLTIQGFYYVALHRMTGRIEALYFDSGSQPYQELSCCPVDSIVGEGGEEGNDGIFQGPGDIGIRKNFGVYEFR